MKAVPIGKIAKIFNGNSISVAEKDKHYRGVSGTPYIGTAEVGFDTAIDYCSCVAIPNEKVGAFKIAKAGTPLVCAEGGSAGRKIGITDRPVCFGNKLFAIEVSADWDGRFLFYFCQSDMFQQQFRTLMTGMIGGVSIKKFKEIKIPTFPLIEQKRIVCILDQAFEHITKAKINAERNLSNTNTLTSQELRTMLAHGREGWFDTTIGEQITLQRGYDITKSQQRAGDIPVVSSSGIKSYHNEPKVRGPGVVIGRKGTLGSSFYLDCDFWPHDTSLYVRDFKGNNPRFVYYVFCGLDVKHLDSGSANPALNRNVVHELPVKWPPLASQEEFCTFLDKLSEGSKLLADAYRKKIRRLDELKQSILHQAFSGNL